MHQKSPLTEFEEIAYQEGYQRIGGVDEAGRGPLAGPVVAVACVFPRGLVIEGIDDSKKLTAKKRANLYQMFVAHPTIDFGVGVVDHQQIDRINILQASLQAMVIAVKNLSIKPDFLLIDGKQAPPTALASKTLIKGDARSQSIAAASIIAKYLRDEMMKAFHLQWPEYGFDQNKGYGTETHIKAISKHRPCPIHRQSFEPIKSMIYPSSDTCLS